MWRSRTITIRSHMGCVDALLLLFALVGAESYKLGRSALHHTAFDSGCCTCLSTPLSVFLVLSLSLFVMALSICICIYAHTYANIKYIYIYNDMLHAAGFNLGSAYHSKT